MGAGAFGFRYGFPLARGGGATPPRETYGALSRAQSGAGISTTATAITGGDPSGHWQIASGRLFPSTVGDTANMNAGPYALTFDNGERLTVTIEANTWDVATQAEWDFVSMQSAATLAGKKIALRNSTLLDTKITGALGTPLRRVDLRDGGGVPLTIEGRFGAVGNWDAYCEINYAYLQGTRGVTFRHLRTAKTNVGKFGCIGEASFVSGDLTLDDCDISGQVADPQGNYTNSANYPNNNIDLISTQGPTDRVASITITRCRIQWGASLVVVSPNIEGASVTINDNEFAYGYEDAIKISVAPGSRNCPVTIARNYIHDPMGLPTDSLALHPDGIQIIGSISRTANYANIVIEENVILRGTARGVMQSIFLDDMKTGSGDSGFFFAATIRRNIVCNSVAQGIWILQAQNCLVEDNTVISFNSLPNTPSIFVGGGGGNATSGGSNTVQRNIADAIGVGSGTTQTGNFIAGGQGVTIPYATLFDGPFNPTTRAEVVRFLRPRVAAGATLAS